MAEAKVQFALGKLSFSGEGDQTWLSEQFEKVLSAAPKLAPLVGTDLGNGESSKSAAESQPFTVTLASHIKEKGGESSQVKRFLATADWLRRRGASSLTTSAVTKALAENQQRKLSNPADSLNANVSKGFCEKSGNGFFVTPDGLKDLGYSPEAA